MRVVFRVDASQQIGTGHIIRCLSLAKALREQGADCQFICRAHPGHLINRIVNEGFTVVSLPFEASWQLKQDDPIMMDYASWLGANWQEDASQSINALADSKPHWLIVDHYAIDVRWEQTLRSFCEKIMVIDDLANRKHNCDLLLDQNLFQNHENRYFGKLNVDCNKLFGPQYALLHPEYAKLHVQVKPRKWPIKNFLIYFGGVDHCNLTGLALYSLIRGDFYADNVDVVISKNSPHYCFMKKLVNNVDKVMLYSDLPSLAPLMMKADLAIGAGGATSWERLSLGLPAIVVTLAENQRSVTEELNQLGLVEWAGESSSINIENIMSSLDKIITRGVDIENWSRRCMEVCEGNGTELVIDAIKSLK